VLQYAPQGWKTPLAESNRGWDAGSVVNAERDKWKDFLGNLEHQGPLGFSHEHTDLANARNLSFHNIHITYAYVLALAAHFKSSLSVLDWGGGLGHYHLIAKAVLPAVGFDFHVKEVPSMAAAGKVLNPEVHWYSDESCLERSYDLVMVNGSLQYMEDWKETLQRLAPAVREYFFLTRLPIVERVPSFVAIQREYGTEMIHQQFNQAEVLKFVESLGLRCVREFVVGDRPYIQGAPEQCELRGWLFKRES
jgi:putative methyltransferase (TIGR04325 family)